MHVFSFEKLAVYQEALNIVPEIYLVSAQFPPAEKFGLASQINRAIISVPSNIAESCGRASYKEKIKFIGIAYGSLLEVVCQLQIAVRVGYLEESKYDDLTNRFRHISYMLTALKKSYESQLNSNENNL